jgi:hypothetical protein
MPKGPNRRSKDSYSYKALFITQYPVRERRLVVQEPGNGRHVVDQPINHVGSGFFLSEAWPTLGLQSEAVVESVPDRIYELR